MGCCSWPLTIISWFSSSYSSHRYEVESDSSDDIPVPKFRDLGEMRYRPEPTVRKYMLRPTKPVCYVEQEDEEGLD